LQDVGVGDLRRDVGAGGIAGERGQSAFLRLVPVEVGVEHRQHLGILGAQPGEQAVTRPHHLGEQLVLGLEVSIEATAGQPGRQHDIVDVGAGVATPPEQPGGMLEDLGPDPGGLGGGWRHFMLYIISYDDYHL
jgi:hypothetical protein